MRVAACFIVLLVALSIGMTVAGGAAFAAAPPTIVSATADPARATVGVAALPRGAGVEIDAIVAL